MSGIVTGSRLAVRGVWCNPDDAGRTPESVAAFVERADAAGINLLAMCVKGVGSLFWPSARFPEAVAEGYAGFDLPAVLLAECRHRGIQFHAWFIDFMESAGGPAASSHPEWAMRNAEGGDTTSETLRGKGYHSVWMCPARRPGYADQWLIPAMAEFAARYDVDAIHHDYIRYPGDLAPDRYCFCDFCLNEIPRFAGYAGDARPDEAFLPEEYDRPYIEALWEPGPRVLPPGWPRMPRAMRSRFLLEGSFFQGGRSDLDYFFYLYRTNAIRRFAREAADAVRAARPGMAISAAVFKNPVHSGRFIGQDWRDFPPSVDIAMPMDYRDHYPGDFETHLVLLDESIRQQAAWACGYRALWPGIAVNQIFREEDRPLRRIARAMEQVAPTPEAATEWAKVEARIRAHAPGLAQAVENWVATGGEAAADGVVEFLRSAPRGYHAEEKLTRTIECVRAAGAEGICLFSAGLLTRCGMWEAVARAFGNDRR